MDYSSVDSLGVAPVLQVVVVREDDYGVGTSYEQVSPVFKAVDDGEELLIIDVVVLFCRVESLRVVPHWSFSPHPFMFLV